MLKFLNLLKRSRWTKLSKQLAFSGFVALIGAGLYVNSASAFENIGRIALPEEIAKWDIDVRPDGQGLPIGKGSAETGETIFAEKCAYCHGDFGEGAGRWPVLAGGQDSLTSARPVKTIGSYWPYLSTVYDYIYRAMPFGEAQSLTPDEVYGLVAYLLYMNDVIDDPEFELNHENFTSVRLPNEAGFYMDDRPDIPNIKDGTPCMKNCKAKVEITGRAVILDVTPDEETTNNMAVD